MVLMKSMSGADDPNSPWMMMYSSSLHFLYKIRPKNMPIPPWKPTNRASPLRQFRPKNSWSREESEILYNILETLLDQIPQYKYLAVAQIIVAQDEHSKMGYERGLPSIYSSYSDHRIRLGALTYRKFLDRKMQPLIYALKSS